MAMLLSEAIEALCIATRADGRSPRTVASYREKLGHLVAYLEDAPVETVTVADLRRYVASLMDQGMLYADHPCHEAKAGSLSPFTIAGRVRAFKRLFNWLESENLIEHNPARRIKTPQPKRKEPKAISMADLLALLGTTDGGAVADLRDRAVILFLADTGARVGGLCGLKVGDLDLARGMAMVTEKGDKDRFVMFNQPTAEALAAWLEVRPDVGPWLFVSLRGRDRMTPNSVYQMLAQRATVAGVSGPVNPHSFRHAFAREYLLSDGDLASLADLLGHSDVSVTKAFYSIFTVGELKEKHKRHSPIPRLLKDEGDA